MSCSASSADREAIQLAERLAGAPIAHAARCTGGGNNRVFRVETTAGRSFALKTYPLVGADRRDRLAHEFDGLAFLARCGAFAQLVPVPIAVDRERRAALYTWIDGAPAADHSVADVTAMLALLERLHRARAMPGAAALPLASEACLDLGDLVAQVRRRLERLRCLGEREPALAAFLDVRFLPELERRADALAGEGSATDPRDADALDDGARDDETRREAGARRIATLSPSDFGFHNALRRADGSLAFIDFEYFGWDDPVKLVSDALWHPGMRLSPVERARFVTGAAAIYAPGDPEFRRRLARHHPWFGLRWCLIVLNEYLPESWARRRLSGETRSREDATRAQLHKAHALLDAVQLDGDPNLS